MSHVVKIAAQSIPAARGQHPDAGPMSAAEEAAIAAAEAVAAEAAAGVAAEAAAQAAVTVSVATAAASQAAIRARRTAEAAAVTAESAVAHAIKRTPGSAVGLTDGIAVGDVIADTAAIAAAKTAAEARLSVAEAIAAEEAAAVVAAAATAAAPVIAAATAASAAAARTRHTIEVAARLAAERAAALIAAAATTAEATLDVASAAAEATLGAASAAAEATIDAAAAVADTTRVAAATTAATRVSIAADSAAQAADGPTEDDLHPENNEWAVMLADPVMARFAWDRAETAVSHVSPAEKGLWRDISLARRMEAALRRDVAEVEAAFFHAPAAMAVLAVAGDRPAEFLRVNPALSQLTGYPLLTLLGLGLEDLAPPRERTVDGRGYPVAPNPGGVPHEMIRRWIHADGHDVWVRIRLAAAGASVEHADRWVCQVEDVTVSARAAQTRRTAHSRLAMPSASATPTSAGKHGVLFYSDERAMLDHVVGCVHEILQGSGQTMVIVTHEDGQALRAALPRRLLAKAERGGRFLLCDARAMLSGFMRDGSPDADLFDETVGDLLVQYGSHTGSVTVIGMMVAELWKAGNESGALQLEELWSELQHRTDITTDITLLCGYPLTVANRREGGLAQVCSPHSGVYLR
ncbi:MAG: MEDS domain-containing protein [Frankiaceae bacterium]